MSILTQLTIWHLVGLAVDDEASRLAQWKSV